MPTDDSTARARLVRRYGPSALDWLAHLPTTVAELTDCWQLTHLRPVHQGSSARTFACRRHDGVPVAHAEKTTLSFDQRLRCGFPC